MASTYTGNMKNAKNTRSQANLKAHTRWSLRQKAAKISLEEKISWENIEKFLDYGKNAHFHFGPKVARISKFASKVT